jgi:2-C-methyl-D-erythritol 4-phosphate cytidylyltransferase
MKKSVIIVAGGSGLRMLQSLPKQFIQIMGKPLLVYTVEAFLAYDPFIQIVLVLPKNHFDTWNQIKEVHLSNEAISLATGGETRFQSVREGLSMVDGDLVAIHDAVRPMVSTTVISSCFESARLTGSGVAMVPLKDSIRETSGENTIARNREHFFSVQTPQTFQVPLIKRAFDRKEMSTFTDDASVFEAAEMTVSRVEGSFDNIKITTPEDLILADALFKNNKSL